jgi:phosphoglycerol transferase
LAEPEKWGAWSEGNNVELTFKRGLPPSFRLTLHARAFGPNGSASIPVTVGNVTKQMAMKGRSRKRYQLDFSDHGGDRTITFAIPHPVAPAELGKSPDQRRLGLGFVRMRIEPIPPAQCQPS